LQDIGRLIELLCSHRKSGALEKEFHNDVASLAASAAGAERRRALHLRFKPGW
jgi:hypothetical protein